MAKWEKYLLPSKLSYANFVAENESVLDKNMRTFKDWIQNLPMMKWIPITFRSEAEAKAVIGTICALCWDNEISVSFNDDMTCIRHEPGNREELFAWMKAAGWHGQGIDRPGR